MSESQALEKLFDLVKQYLKECPEKVVEYLPPEELKAVLELDKSKKSGDMDVVLGEIEKYLQYAVCTRHPQYFNQMWAGLSFPVFMGEIISALCNTSMYTYEVAPVATLLEQQLLSEILDIVGFPNGEAQFTTGGSHGNMIAMMIARNKVLNNIKEQGLFGHRRLTAFISAECHYSYDKAANILGLGTDSIIKIPVDAYGKMDPRILQASIERSREKGELPFFVGATAGTTVRGAYDDIDTLREIAHGYGMWMHVDGAWGGSMILSSQRQKFFKGIDLVDSFVWDAHKMMGMTLMCSILAIRKRGHFDQTCNLGDTSYIFHDPDECRDLGPYSLQCGRRNDILKFWLEWQYVGQDGFQKRMDHFLDLIQHGYEIIRNTPELELMDHHSPLNLCFRYNTEEIEDLDAFNIQVRKNLYQKGVSFINYGYLAEKAVIRLIVANKNLRKSDIDQFFKNFLAEAKSLHT